MWCQYDGAPPDRRGVIFEWLSDKNTHKPSNVVRAII